MKRLALLVLFLASPAWAEVRFIVGDAYGVPGETVAFEIFMERGTDYVASASLVFAPPAGVTFAVGTDGHPDCDVDYRVTLTSFRFREANTIRGSVLGEEDGLRPTGPLYRCRLAIAANAEIGDFQLAITEALWADPVGFEHDGGIVNGVVHVLPESVATPTLTRTATLTPTPTPVPTNTTTPTATPTGTPTPFPVQLPVVIAAVFDPVPPLIADVNADRRVGVADIVAYFRHFSR